MLASADWSVPFDAEQSAGLAHLKGNAMYCWAPGSACTAEFEQDSKLACKSPEAPTMSLPGSAALSAKPSSSVFACMGVNSAAGLARRCQIPKLMTKP